MTVVVGTREVVAVTGDDAVAFLGGQLSADVAALAEGTATWSFLLQPSGRLGFWLRVHRRPDGLLLDVEAGQGAAVVARLQRFLLRVDAVVAPTGWGAATFVGPDAAAAADALAGDLGPAAVVAPRRSPAGLVAVDVLTPDAAGIAALGADGPSGALDAARVAAGWPGLPDLVEDAVPAELGQWVVDASVSFTKGCYTGQELVARVDSRGAETPFHLRRLERPASAPVFSTGAVVRHGGTDRGAVSTVALVDGAPAALARVHRSVAVGEEVEVDGAPAIVADPADGASAP